MKLQKKAALVALAVAMILLGSCGLSSVRRQQDWSAVSDSRLYLTCQVGNYGSGVLLSASTEGATVLTCAHLVEQGDTVTVHFFDPAARRWVHYDGDVTLATHQHKEDLALIRITSADFHLPPQATTLAPPVEVAQTFEVSLANIAFGAEKRPFMLDAPAFAHVAKVRSFKPDEDGETSWKLTKLLLHGGVLQASSGSPVFRGNQLVGLVESAPGFAMKDGALVQGVVVGSPDTIHSIRR